MLSVKKCILYKDKMKFVGHDVCDDGNRPAQSKRKLIENWPKFRIVRDLHSFMGFMNFFSYYIPNMELRVRGIRELMKRDMEENIESV